MSSENIRPNQIRQDALDGRLTFDQARNRIMGRDDDGLARLLILADGVDFDMKVAKPGFDATIATDDQLIFNSSQNIFKIVGVGTGLAPAVTTVADGTNTYSAGATNNYAHGLSFTPSVIAYVEVSPNQYSLMPYSETVSANSPSGGIVSQFYRITAGPTNISIFRYTISYSPGLGAGTYSSANVKYYLLQETAN